MVANPVIPVIAGLLGAVIGALATVTTGAFGFLNKDRELDIRMVDIGLSILSSDSKDTDAEPGRRFALRLLKEYAQVDIPQGEFDDWASRGTLDVSVLPRFVSQQRLEITDNISALEARAKDLRFALAAQSQGVDGLAGRGPKYNEIREKILKINAEAEAFRSRLKVLDDLIQSLDGAAPQDSP